MKVSGWARLYTRPFWLLAMITTGAVFAINAVFIYLAVQTIEQDVSAKHLEIVKRAGALIVKSLEDFSVESRRLASEVGRQPDQASEILALALRDNPEFEQISLTNASGAEIARLNRLSVITKQDLVNFGQDERFRRALAENGFISNVFFSNRAEPFVTIFTPIRSPAAELTGMLITDLNLKFMWNLVGEVRVGPRGKIYVVDANGNLIADPNPTLVLKGENLLSRSIVKKITSGAAVVDGLDPADRYKNFEGVDVFASSIRLEPFGWGVISEEPTADALVARQRTLTVGIGSSAIIFAILFLLIFAIRRLFYTTQNLQEEKTHTLAVVSNLTDGLIEYSTDLKLLLINPVAEKLLGIRAEELINANINDPAHLKNPQLKSFLAVFAPDNDLTKTKPMLHKENRAVQEITIETPVELSLKVTTFPIVDASGKVISNAKLLQDISREKFIGQMKSDFISIAAHQLRTPLSGIKWTLRTLLDGDLGTLNSKQIEFLEKGYLSNERMISLVSDLLDVSRIEEGRFGYEFREENFVEFLEKFLSELKTQLEAKKIKLEFRAPPNFPKIFFDPEKMTLALENIFDNSVKYTHEGGNIWVELARKDPYLELSVKDNGVGIPKKQMPRLFTKFFRGDNVIKMQTEGSGLGLFIIKNVVASHGGEVKIESEENRGTTVVVSLPLRKELVPEKETPLEEFSSFIKGF